MGLAEKPKEKVTRGASFTESSRTSCRKAETSQEGMAWAVDLSMETSLLTRTSCFLIMVLVGWKAVVFGKVIKGMSMVRKVEDNMTDGRDRPVKDVKIVDCGGEKVASPFTDLGGCY